MARHLTKDEIERILGPIFRYSLRYHSIRCDINTGNVGGVSNSITPAGVAHFSKLVYCEDFFKATADDQWVFVHEMTHVWQWAHGVYPIWSAVGIFLQKKGDYANAYPYDLAPGKKLDDFNIEQQASIVADFWALATKKLSAQNNNNAKATVGDYVDLIDEARNAGPPLSKSDIPL